MTSGAVALLLGLVASAAMTGVIWTVQLVVYPAFAWVGPGEIAAYHAHHSDSISLIVAPLMLAELVAAVWLLFDRPAGIGLPLVITGLTMAAATWLQTGLWFLPLHTDVAAGVAGSVQRLVAVNWLRTATWTAHLGVVVVMAVLAWRAADPSAA